MKKYLILIIAAFISITIFTPAFAFPTLQLYMPDAVYYAQNPWVPGSGETWITTSNPFELWAVGAQTPNGVTYIDNVTLHIALLNTEYPTGNIHVMTITGEDNIWTLYRNDFELGQPNEINQPHGIYPTYFTSLLLPNLNVLTANDTIYNYNETFDPLNPGTPKNGDIQKYSIEYNKEIFNYIHFDLSGKANRGDKSWAVNAPFSHDADTAPIPEPTTMSLLGLGLLGLLGLRKKVKKV